MTLDSNRQLHHPMMGLDVILPTSHCNTQGVGVCLSAAAIAYEKSVDYPHSSTVTISCRNGRRFAAAILSVSRLTLPLKKHAKSGYGKSYLLRFRRAAANIK